MNNKQSTAYFDIFSADTSEAMNIAFVSAVSAGFPSPADDYLEKSIDLNQILVKNKEATFYARVHGDSMVEDGIEEGDVLIIDRSIKSVHGSTVVCFINGSFTLKRLFLRGQDYWLLPANRNFQPIPIDPNDDFMVWGVVTYIIKKCKLHGSFSGL